ncbi:MAG: thiamine pyrophosphate-binding protein [Gammaproteobacteria bacterium]|nr:thiamine pyrophosphate-binding protein [Gammaproteobacteria bacterium]
MNDSPIAPASTTGRAAFLSLLASEGVDVLFGNPGTTELAIMEALSGQSQIEFVLGLQESIVVGMADGYARASGRLAACNVHVAPGLGNALGSLYNAKFYGSPVLLTAGQQEQGFGLMEPMLYDPLVPMAQPYVKWAIEVTRVQDLPRIIRRAAKVALTPPTGPVFISLPGDILDGVAELDLGFPTRVDTATRPADGALELLANALLEARNPVIIAGHELALHQAFDEAAALAAMLAIPVYQQTVPSAAHFLSAHPAYKGPISRLQPQVHDTLAPHDLLVLLGSDQLRMGVFNRIDPLPTGMRIIQISERPWELAKNYPTEIALNANIKETLKALLPVISAKLDATQRQARAAKLAVLATDNWTVRRERARQEAQLCAATRPIDPHYLMMRLTEVLPRDVVVVEEGLTATVTLLRHLPFHDPKGFYGLASGGIGFAMAGAVGISLALRQRPIVAIVGDGSAMYSIQALWTAAHLKLPITYVIPNNRGYRIIKERLKILRGSENFIGMDFVDPEIDFVMLARSLGVPAQRIVDPAEIGPAIQTALASGGPSLLDISVANGFGQ